MTDTLFQKLDKCLDGSTWTISDYNALADVAREQHALLIQCAKFVDWNFNEDDKEDIDLQAALIEAGYI